MITLFPYSHPTEHSVAPRAKGVAGNMEHALVLRRVCAISNQTMYDWW